MSGKEPKAEEHIISLGEKTPEGERSELSKAFDDLEFGGEKTILLNTAIDFSDLEDDDEDEDEDEDE